MAELKLLVPLALLAALCGWFYPDLLDLLPHPNLLPELTIIIERPEHHAQ